MQIYVATFWLSSAGTIVFRFASQDRQATLKAAKDYIVSENVPDAGYENFLLSGLSEWDGEAVDATALPAGHLVLFSVDLDNQQ